MKRALARPSVGAHTVIPILFALLAMGATQEAAVPKPEPARAVVLSAGTQVRLASSQKFSSKKLKGGEVLHFHLPEPLVFENRVLAPQGTSVNGTVRRIVRPREMLVDAQMELDMDDLVLTDGTRMRLVVPALTAGEDAYWSAKGAAVATAKMMFWWTPFSKGAPVAMKAGDPLFVFVKKELRLDPGRFREAPRSSEIDAEVIMYRFSGNGFAMGKGDVFCGAVKIPKPKGLKDGMRVLLPPGHYFFQAESGEPVELTLAAGQREFLALRRLSTDKSDRSFLVHTTAADYESMHTRDPIKRTADLRGADPQQLHAQPSKQ